MPSILLDQVTKRILHYLKGTQNLALKYEKSESLSLTGYSDADWASDGDDRHSTISWLSKKQVVIALSTAEAEYVALSAATHEAIWLKKLVSD